MIRNYSSNWRRQILQRDYLSLQIHYNFQHDNNNTLRVVVLPSCLLFRPLIAFALHTYLLGNGSYFFCRKRILNILSCDEKAGL